MGISFLFSYTRFVFSIYVKKIAFIIILLMVYFYRLITYVDVETTPIISGENYQMTGVVSASPDIDKTRYTFKIKITDICRISPSGEIVVMSCNHHGLVGYTSVRVSTHMIDTLISTHTIAKIDVGDRVTIIGKINRNKNCSVEVCDPKEKSFANYLRRQEIFTEISSPKIIDIETHVSHPIKRMLIDVRILLEHKIDTFIERPYSDLAKGLVISGKGSMSDELLEDFKNVGLIHIVVLSGSNVSIISVALFSLLRQLPLFIRSLSGILMMVSFAVMTGGAPPVVRSVCMTSIPIIMLMLKEIRALLISRHDQKKDRVTLNGNHESVPVESDSTTLIPEKSFSMFLESESSLYTLLLVGIGLSIMNPLMPIYDMSFQLSFMATFGLMSLSGVMTKIFFFLPKKYGIQEIVSCSLATQVFVLPLLLILDDRMSLVFLIANILVLPMLPFTMLLVFVTLLSSFIADPIAVICGHVSWMFLQWIIGVSAYLSDWKYSTMSIALLSPIDVVSIFVLLIPIALLLKYYVYFKKK